MPLKSSHITMSDYFCGAGGSSTGAAAVPGVEVTFAANHWPLAIETHATNHPNTQHDTSDLQEVLPSMFPGSTIAWFSPECQSHSNAKGKKRIAINQMDLWGKTGVDPLEERSRATLREVVEFSEYHRYEAVIVENVTEIRAWEHFEAWLKAMINLGYDHRQVFLNSRHAYLTPQSRDRLYVVFWKRGNKAPDLEIRPVAFCKTCGKDVESKFSPNPKGLPSRVLYGKSYVYCCAACGYRVEPYSRGSETVIDWSLPTVPIKDKGLVENTLSRIQAGLNKYRGETFISSYYSRDSAHAPTTEPMPTIPTENRHALIVPKRFISTYYGNGSNVSVEDPTPAVTTKDHHALISPTESWSLDEAGYRMLEAQELKLAMSFPESYRILGKDWEVKKQIGNAVTASSAKLLVERVVASLL